MKTVKSLKQQIQHLNQRPLSHLDGQHLLCSGWLSSWRESPSSLSMDVCLSGVKCMDWDTGKTELAKLDHAWLRLTEGCWRTWQKERKFAKGFGPRLSDEVFFVARPQHYRRSDGSEDWGLYLLSMVPQNPLQMENAGNAHRKLSRPSHYGNNTYRLGAVALDLLEAKLEDWRIYSKRGPADAIDLCKKVKRNGKRILSPEQIDTIDTDLKLSCGKQIKLILAGKAEEFEEYKRLNGIDN